jgi:preprotein translocase subunit SecY
MVVSRGKTPSAQETFMQMAQAAGLRSRILVTLGLLVLVRLGVFIPVPGIDRDAFASAIASGNLGASSALSIFLWAVVCQPWGFLPWAFCRSLMPPSSCSC